MYFASNTADKQTRPTSRRTAIAISVLQAVLLLTSERQIQRCVICPEVAEIYALMGYYAASSANFLPMFRDNLSVSSSGFKNPIILRVQESNDHQGSRIQRFSGFKKPRFLNPENGTDRLSRNVGNKLPILAV